MSHYQSVLRNTNLLDKTIRIALVVGEFNLEYTGKLEQLNREFLEAQGFSNVESYFVPGAFEIPGFAKRLIETGKYDLIIAIGVVIRGDTPHFDYVCNEASRGIMNLNTTYSTPTIFGILTCNTEEQVIERMGHGFAVSGLNLLTELKKL